MARKTNKTNHVLGLLAGKNDEAPEAANNKEKEAALAEDTNVQVVAKQEEDDAIADTVKQLLEEELETEEDGMPVITESIFDDADELEALRAAEAEAKELFEEEKRAEEEAKRAAEEEARKAEEAAKQAEEARKAEEEKAREAEEARKAEEEKAREAEEAQAKEAARKAEEAAQAADEAEALKKAEAAAPEAEKEKEYVFLNVMETLVREKVESYMNQFATCHCSRCEADIIALALTSLPSKYVVVSKNAATPLMNFYSQRYAGAITVEITKACTKVKEHPHHGRD